MTIALVTWSDVATAERRALLARPSIKSDESIRATVADIVSQVRQGGDQALLALTRHFDNVALDSLVVDEAEVRAAGQKIDADSLAAIDLSIANVRRFHAAQLPADTSVETMPGVLCERIAQPLDAVGLYVPAGSAPLPSAAIMLAVPAALAGCPTRILCTPPRPDGRAD
ncbi:MAG TPA: histidinol dehydrogenase, partial [Woeseiaceae bacterium]|nr:histidinol dehydrogenase [Woeseiaceae bacterium]